ncbi:molybdopterin-guanine dinucleotide biosynthesis protein MobA [Spirochaetia bacterium]|nr:molybdopterin-guanine dinucleotide biosynthesis protein MobA [Spirochaetia bacterium]
MYLSVNKVQPLHDYKLELTFENNETKIFDVKPYLDTGLFKTLKDENFFKRVKISYDTIEWPNGIDLDPEVLYEKSEMKNKKIL